MAQFRGTVQGNRGEASRLGSKNSGLDVSASGWNVGCKVTVRHEDGRDVVRVWRTTGSNGYGHSTKLIASFADGDPATHLGDIPDPQR
ncbi:hypothetical protein SEA_SERENDIPITOUS_60 [Mycobacterium phage Serendipitous]|uniref:Uncharacterized protein n=1 Tax=Mycobacterium phage Serendipitous TaxID=2301619 RepID=A0A385UG64_9CAUD|nr:hypothetical protein I5G64_gp60 [Mycobacterium phage Serendipitous]AYB70601.1 hypothetical protein SEA_SERENDIPITOUS_60 [Mycobacterium phage Serendipitous]